MTYSQLSRFVTPGIAFMVCQEPQQRRIGQSVRIRGGSLPEPHHVQVRSAEAGEWRMYARFRFQGEAEACLDALRQRGIEARIVESRT